jgi:hypothetical protein
MPARVCVAKKKAASSMTTDQAEIKRISEQLTDDVLERMPNSSRWLKTIVALIVPSVVGGTLFVWDLSEERVLDQAHEAKQDERIEQISADTDANYNTILELATLHIMQGRFVERQIKQIAPVGTVFEDRPDALTEAEDKLTKRQPR